MSHVVIIGNGIAGITAARNIRKLGDDRITVISSESDHFYARTALMYIYMGHMTYEHTKPYEDWFWQKNRINLIRGYVQSVDTDKRLLSIDGNRTLQYDKLIIATGSVPNKFGWPGQDLIGVQGLYSIQDLDLMQSQTDGIRRAVVVGGGLIGIEMAEMLHSRHIPVTFLVREASYMDYLLPREESEMINDEILRHNIDLRLSTELHEIKGDAGAATGIVTDSREEISAEFIGLTVGVRPSVSFLESSKIELSRGILVNEYFETSVDSVYAIGDCAEFREEGIGHRRIEQLWYSGRRHGEAVANIVAGTRRPYDKKTFFNSAKFFTIEYQTYGTVSVTPDPSITSFVWTDKSSRQLVRIEYETATRIVKGFNVLGLRFRQETCEKWIRTEATIDDVLVGLRQADFDPEFARSTDINIRASFQKTRGGRQTSSPVAT